MKTKTVSPPGRIAALDIGTHKTVVLIGQVVDRKVRLLGFGERRTDGVVKGVVQDLERLNDCVHQVVADAERSAGVALHEIYASVNGPMVDGERVKGMMPVPGRDRRVTAADVEAANLSARRIEPPPGRYTLLYMRQPTLLDGKQVGNPVGMTGERLEVNFWRVTHEEGTLRQRVGMLNGMSLHCRDFLLGSHAAGCSVVTDAEKRTGCLVIDFGAGTTSWILYYREHILCAGSIPVGGEHVTNDLCSALRVRREFAEDIKLRYASALHRPEDANLTILKEGAAGGDQQFNRGTINLVTSVRIRELLEQVRQDIQVRMRGIFGRDLEMTPALLPSGVVLTGGASQLAGLTEAAADALGLPARLGVPSTEAEALRKPEYACVLGVMAAALVHEAPVRRPARGFWAQVRNLFRL
ncbi:MAG: cell division protein FtsA [Opitutales bacterium]|jgi:cell division protein FtsA